MEMTCFFPIMNAKAYNWPCQVLLSSRWTKGLAAAMGEEHDQVFFSKMRFYANNTKVMSAANRNDHLSMAIFYWNRFKFEGMVDMLLVRIKRVCYLFFQL